MMREKEAMSVPGFVMLATLLVVGGLAAFALFNMVTAGVHAHDAYGGHGPPPGPVVGLLGLGLVEIIGLRGFFVVQPNQAVVMQFFGRYSGTVREQGLRWSNPFFTRTRVSLRVRNFESAVLKVNDLDGNPVEIAAVVVWRVKDTAEAAFAVDNYIGFVQVQAESALRGLATRFPYDAHEEHQISLRGHADVVAEQLVKDVQERLSRAGVEVVEARITKLAYAQEIAQAMLQRQQAGAIIAARQRIVDGAVGMVEMALKRLSENQTVQLDEERKAAMVSNLLVVLCGERGAQPIVNTGTLYNG